MKKNATGDSQQTLRDEQQHQPWCDPAQHELTADGADLAKTGCVGRAIKVAGGLGGWWRQSEPGAEPQFVVDAFGGGWAPTVRDLQVVEDLLSHPGADPDQLLDLIVTAQGEFEHGILAGGQA